MNWTLCLSFYFQRISRFTFWAFRKIISILLYLILFYGKKTILITYSLSKEEYKWEQNKMQRKKHERGLSQLSLSFFKKSSIFSRNKSIFLSKWRIVLIHGKRDIMTKPIKTKLIIVIIGALLYILLNFLPFSRWIENEYGYLALRFTVLLLMSIALILLKKKNHIELEIPHHQISCSYWPP